MSGKKKRTTISQTRTKRHLPGVIRTRCARAAASRLFALLGTTLWRRILSITIRVSSERAFEIELINHAQAKAHSRPEEGGQEGAFEQQVSRPVQAEGELGQQGQMQEGDTAILCIAVDRLQAHREEISKKYKQWDKAGQAHLVEHGQEGIVRARIAIPDFKTKGDSESFSNERVPSEPSPGFFPCCKSKLPIPVLP